MKPNLFNSVKMTQVKKNVFDLSHDVKFSADMGYLVPTLCMECVPGDKVTLGCEALIRFAPMVAPTMHRIDAYTHYFFVPNRLLWENWEDFITNLGTEGDPPPAFPYFVLDKDHTAILPLLDYLGIPNPEAVAAEADMNISALPFAAYQFIFNEYYRDQNLSGEVPFQLADGNNGVISGLAPSTTIASNLATIRRRAWEHDYFTAALPFAQKGSAIDIPLGTVVPDDDLAGKFPHFRYTDPANPLAPVPGDGSINQNFTDLTPPPPFGIYSSADAGSSSDQNTLFYDPAGTLSVEPTTINDLRLAFRLQEWLEKNARGGTRYIENIRAHFGVKSSDRRLQRPEYITGTKSNVIISEVLNTTGTEDNPQGNMAGHGISVTNGKYGSYFCEEHGYIIGITSVIPKTAYQQGLPKHFLKTESPLQYYWPSFAHLGEQEVLNKEIYAWGTNQNGVFGYVPRYSEYKYLPSRVCGDFRTTLDFWHLGRKFATQPQLNHDFIVCNPGKRIFAVTDGPQSLWCHMLHNIRAVRPMPKYGTPTF